MSGQDRFRPLREDQTLKPPPKDDGWTTIVPVPKLAPELPAKTIEDATPPGHKDVQKWDYLDADGNLTAIVVRYNAPANGDGKPSKQFKQFTYCCRAGHYEWRPKSLPHPRPLYRLGELVARPEAPVLIVEGERKAEAAALLFPDYVVTSSSHGASSAKTADWSVLTGRDVTIWRDNDAPRAEDAKAVAELLQPLASQVRIVEILADVGFSEGWDLADEQPDGADLRAMLDAAIPPKQKPEAVPKAKKPNGSDPKSAGFSMTPKGLFWADPGDSEKPKIFVSGPFEVLRGTVTTPATFGGCF